MQTGFLMSTVCLIILVSDNCTFQTDFLPYSSSPLFHAHNFFWAYLHFLQLNITTIILEGQLSHKYLNFVYTGLRQRMISHSKK